MTGEDMKILQEAFAYCPETGLFTWLIPVPPKGINAGDVAGQVTRRGYRRLTVRNKGFQEHRVAWLFATGEWPAQQIDHINGIKTDNRVANLRLATPSQNSANTESRGALLRGVARVRGSKRYFAQLKHLGTNHYLGSFDTEAEAHEAYRRKSKEIHGDFSFLARTA